MGTLKESGRHWRSAVKPDQVQKHKGGGWRKAAKAADFLLFR
jgi:hypothetical protein